MWFSVLFVTVAGGIFVMQKISLQPQSYVSEQIEDSDSSSKVQAISDEKQIAKLKPLLDNSVSVVGESGFSTKESAIQRSQDLAATADKELEPVTEPISVKKPEPKIFIFPTKLEDATAFTSFKKRSELIVIEADSIWTRVYATSGFPVWVSAPLVEKIGASHVRVTANTVNARSSPDVKLGKVLGKLQKGDVLKVSRKQGDWIRVWSPIKFAAWVKSDQLVPEGFVSSSETTPAQSSE